MAADKLNWNELRRAIMQRTDATEQEATAFLNAFIEQIIDALKTDKQVRINGLGTFRLQSMQPRKSVNIATGEEIVIDGYNKVAFTPEASVKEMIGNNPTPDNAPQPKTTKKKRDAESEELTPIQKLGQQADEIVDLLADLGQKPNTGNIVPTPATEEPKDKPADELNEEPTEENPNIEEIPQQEEKPVEPVPDTTIEEREEKPAEPAIPLPIAEEENKKEEPKQTTEKKAEGEKVEEKKEEKEKTEETTEKKPKRKYHFWRDTLICVICLLIVLVCGYFFGRAALSNWVESLGQKTTPIDTTIAVVPSEQITQPTPSATEGTPIDTLTEIPTIEPADTPSIAEEGATSTEITYSAYLATEQINEGSRLTWLAYRYYGNKALWVYIYDANKDHLTDPNHIQVGTAIRIPKLTDLQRDTTNAQTKQTIERLKAVANANAK